MTSTPASWQRATASFVGAPAKDTSFHAFVESLPDILVARDFRKVVDAIVNAAETKKAVVVMLGGHIVKTGLAPLLVHLMERKVITHIAMNGSAAIHDFEIARFGGTSEDVAAGLKDGTFGMAEETGREMNEAFIEGRKRGVGMGEALQAKLEQVEAQGFVGGVIHHAGADHRHRADAQRLGAATGARQGATQQGRDSPTQHGPGASPQTHRSSAAAQRFHRFCIANG